jgi:hypothetical protein
MEHMRIKLLSFLIALAAIVAATATHSADRWLLGVGKPAASGGRAKLIAEAANWGGPF